MLVAAHSPFIVGLMVVFRRLMIFMLRPCRGPSTVGRMDGVAWLDLNSMVIHGSSVDLQPRQASIVAFQTDFCGGWQLDHEINVINTE